MPRKLKYHEKKLLKKVDFYGYKSDENIREAEVIRRYHIQQRGDYDKYNRIAGLIRKLTAKIQKLDPKDPYRIKITDLILEKLYNMGLIPTRSSLVQCDKITASQFCRRRLPVVLMKLKFAENLKEATTFIEQGHIRVGPEVVTDPAFLVTRTYEDFITWADSSKIKRHVLKYNDKLDDYDLL